MRMKGRVPDAGLRRSLRDRYQATIGEGLSMMQTALKLSPGASDPPAYLNLLYREAACLADTDEEYKNLIAKADTLVSQALAARKAQSLHGSDSGKLNVEGPPPLGMTMKPLPPPPPLPPPAGYRPGQ
jgi:hypothetical protein